jgi:hypothetical protein
MAITKFKLLFETDVPDIDVPLFQKSLPSSFKAYEDNGDIFVDIETSIEEDFNTKYLIDRELDRHFFITCVKIKAEMIKRRLSASLDMRYRIHGELPENIQPQEWNYELPLQLRLWSMAIDLYNEFRLQILYYYHIIELAYPDKSSFPKYTDPTTPPHPLTECKFLRHLIAHAGDVSNKQLKLYCQYLDIPEKMYDVTDVQYQSKLLGKVKLLENEAEKAIEKNL